MSQVKTGIVTSTKMQNTIVVKVTSKQKHPFYKKLITKSNKFKVRDEMGSKVGQKVKIQETKPFSKKVYFKVVEVEK